MPLKIRMIMLLFVLGPAPAMATSLSDIRQEIVGTANRKWIVQNIIVFKGGGAQCRSGDVYRFNADATAEHSVCTNGSLVSTQVTWSLSESGDGDTIMHLGNENYTLSFGPTNGPPTMRLQGSEACQHAKLCDTAEIYMRRVGQ